MSEASDSQASIPEISERGDPFVAVLQVMDGVEGRMDPTGQLQLRRKVTARTGLQRFLAKFFGWNDVHRLNLDAAGTFFWRQIDGQRNLAAIADAMAAEYSMPRDDAREASVRYTKALMLRYFVGLKVRVTEHER